MTIRSKRSSVAISSWVGMTLTGILGWTTVSAQVSLPSASAVSPAQAASVSSAPVDACAALTGRRLPSGFVEGAERFANGDTIVGGETAGAKVTSNLCRVRVRLQPVPGSDIKAEVWLPEKWNRKLFGFGGAGFDGGLSPGGAQMLNKAAGEGYAAVQTDAGHKPAPGLEPWVHRQPEKVVDFGHRANHLSAVAAKQVIAAYYGDPAKHAYFLGCSNGGREALMEATRYPEDYDGIIAGAPARRYVEVLTQLLWYHHAVHGPGGAPKLASKLGLVHDAVMKKCDRLDGVQDGVLENPLRCRFDPAVLQCKAAEADSCLTRAEVGAFRKIYGGTRLSHGRQVFSGPVVGSEGVADNWSAWVTPPVTGVYGQEFYRWMVHDDPQWKLDAFQFDRDYPVAKKKLGPILNVESADLRAFVQRGGRLIVYQGWNDPIIAPTETIGYVDAVRRSVGPAANQHLRLFMVPGMTHCAGGPGATVFDMQPALEKWVERGEAPERVVAVKPASTVDPLSRPLCAWPKTAQYKGSGSTRDAANFTCKAP